MKHRVVATQVLIQDELEYPVLAELTDQQYLLLLIHFQPSGVGQVPEAETLELLVLGTDDEHTAQFALDGGLLEGTRVSEVDVF